MKLPTIPTIELSPETGTITNALDLAAWLRYNSPDWSHIEDVARIHQMNRIERLELLALSFGLALERAKQDAVERELRMTRRIFAIDPAFPLDHNVHAFTHVKEVERLMEQDPFATPLDPEPMPETIKPKDPADLAPAVFIGIGLFFAIAAGVLAMTGHGLAAGICGLTSLLSLVRASKFPA